MKNRIALAIAGLLALACAPEAAHAAACANGATNGYTTKLADGTIQCVVAAVLPDGRIVQMAAPVDGTQVPPVAISPATAGAQTTGNNTLASILSAQTAQATAAKQDTGNTALASILSGMATASLQGTANATLGSPTAAAATAYNDATSTLLAQMRLQNQYNAQAAASLNPTATWQTTLDTDLKSTLPRVLSAGEAHVGQVGGDTIVATASFVRPANATAYASGQLVANSTTAGSVAPLALTVARKAAGTGRITRIRLSDSNPLAGTAVFRVHLFKTAPTSTVGDGGTFAGAVNGVASVYLGAFDVTLDKVFSDGAKGIGTVNVGAYVSFDAAAGSQALYALVEARSAYTPTAGETLTVAAEADRD